MLSLLRHLPWQNLFLQRQQAEDGPALPVEGEDEAIADSEAVLDGGVVDPGPEVAPIEIDPITDLIDVAPAPVKTDPIEALTGTAETATEAAEDLVNWLGTGQSDAILAVALVIGLIFIQYFLRWALLKGARRLPRTDDYSFSAMFQRVIRRFNIFSMIAIASVITNAVLTLPESISELVKVVFVLASVLQVAVWVQEFAVSSIRRNVHRGAGDAIALASAFNIIKWSIGFVVWSVAILLILDNIGTNITALLAGLGIGGLALGFAAQGVFRDIFSSLSIVIDKPFQIGDTIRYGDTWGAVEEIGLKTTRIRAKSGEQIIMSNTNLLEFEIHNMQRMTRRRIEAEFGVIYQTDPDVADRIPGIVAEMVKSVQGVEFDRCGMSGFGPSSLDYSMVFYSLHPDFNRSMAARSRVLLALLRTFKQHGIEFAYPTQTLFIEGMGKQPVNVKTRTETA